MERVYTHILKEHFALNDQMAFISGPRQVGKTTIAVAVEKGANFFNHFNWDVPNDRDKILQGYNLITENLPMEGILIDRPAIILDEIHKYKQWKNYLKGFFDSYKGKLNILVTGSSRLNVFRRGGDSLMGRYFLYRIHPFSIGELIRTTMVSANTAISNDLISNPCALDDDLFNELLEFGGFPEPFIKQNKRFYGQWQNLRQEQMFQEDIRDIAQIQDLAQLEILAIHLQQQSGQLLNYTSLSKKIRVSDSTVRRWIKVLEAFYYCFTLSPWSKNVARSLLKEPKVYLWDWSMIEDRGARIENFVASHLLKAVHFWTDLGFGKFNLHFIRDKQKKEVDFLITKNKQPWILIEVKNSAKEPLSNNLHYFQQQIKAEHVLQVAFDMPYIDCDFRSLLEPKVVPLKTFLSQLI